MSKELINGIIEWIKTSCKSELPYEFHAKAISDKCKDVAVKAILHQPARNMTRRQAIQAINKAFE